MKAGWKTMRLGDVCHVYQPETLSQKQLKDGPYPVYGANGQIGVHSDYNHENSELTLGCRGTCGSVNWTRGKTWINGNAMVVKPDLSLIDPHFLTYALKGGINIQEAISGTAQPQITRKSLSPLEIPLPPLAEQKRIVALLDEAFAGIDEAKAKTEACIQSLGTLVVSEFQSLVDDKGFERKPLPELASHTLGKMLDKKKNTGTPRPYLRNVNVRWFEFDLSDMHEMPIRDEEAVRCQARKGDVLMCEGGYPGRCAIWGSEEPVFFQKALHRIRFNDKWMAEWFVNYMHSLDSSGKISDFFTGTGIQHLTGETLAKLKIPVPPKSEIEDYVKKISAIRDKTNELAANESAKVNALSELKSSLLSQAFAGELTA